MLFNLLNWVTTGALGRFEAAYRLWSVGPGIAAVARSGFRSRAAMLGAQYASYEPVPGLHINADLTMGENIGDLGGLSIRLFRP